MPFDITALTPQAQVAAIYIGYYDRAADPFGSAFWESAVANPALTLTDIATDFATQKETLGVHPFFSNPSPEAAEGFIGELYLNLFNRAPDAAGLEFWSGVLQNAIAGAGNITVGEIIMQIIAGAQDTAETKDLTTITNKIAVAVAWTDAANEGGLNESSSYGDNAAAQASAKSIIEGVTDDVETLETATSTIRMFEVSLKAAVATDALAAVAEAQAEADEAEAAATDAEGAQAYVQAAAALKTAADQALADALASEEIAKEAKLAAAVTDETEDDAAAAAAFEAATAAIEAAEAAVDAAEDEIENAAEAVIAAQPGDDFTLTIGNDVLTGTTGVDVFFAPLSKDADGDVQLQTLGFDDIDGGLGIDTLNAVLIDDETEISDDDDINDLNPVLKSIEILNLTSRSDNGDIELDNADSVQQLWNVGSTADLEVHEVQNGVIIGMKNVDKDTDFYVDYAVGAVGSNYTQKLVLDGVGSLTSGSVQLDIDLMGEDDEIVGLDITASGNNSIELDDDAEDSIEEIVIAGDGELTLLGMDYNFEYLETLDATAYSGNLTTNISDSTSLKSALLGDGDDNLTVFAGQVGTENSDRFPTNGQLNPKNDTLIDGGKGDDTLNLYRPQSDFDELDFTNVSGFEHLVLSGLVVEHDGTIDISQTDFTSLTMGSLTSAYFTVSASESFDTITLTGDIDPFTPGNNPSQMTLEGFKDLTLNLEHEGERSTFDIVANDVTDVVINLDAGSVEFNINYLEADKLETLKVELGKDGSLNGPQGDSAAPDLTSVIVTGGSDSEVDLFFGDEEESLETVDLSQMSGKSYVGFGDEVPNELTILIGDGSLQYGLNDAFDTGEAGNSSREVFKFVGDDIGSIEIDNFLSSVGGNGDRLDFSSFIAVTTLEDLNIVYDDIKEETIITSNGDQFSGEITVLGIDLSGDDYNFSF